MTLGSAALDGVRVGVPAELLAIPLQPAVQDGFTRALAALKVWAPGYWTYPCHCSRGRPRSTTRSSRRRQWPSICTGSPAGSWAGKSVTATMWRSCWQWAPEFPGTATILAQRNRIELGYQPNRMFAESADVLLTPTQPSAAIPLDRAGMDLDAMIHFLCPFSLTGVPALALPSGADDHGLPVSVQIVGPRLHDPRVLAVGRALGDGFRVRPPTEPMSMCVGVASTGWADDGRGGLGLGRSIRPFLWAWHLRNN